MSRRNNIEILRAFYFDEDDYENIVGANDKFSDKEREFMREFKKSYELGLNQLEKFIKKLKDEGDELEIWDVVYYVTQLLNSPLSTHARAIAKELEVPYFDEIPNTMGSLGNNNSTQTNTTVSEGYQHPLGVMVDIFNYAPDFIQDTILRSVPIVEDLFRSSLHSSTIIDNTLPLMDKKPQDRYVEEPKGEWVVKSNGSYLVKDSYYIKVMEDIRSVIFDKVEEFLGEENFKIFTDNKKYQQFDSEYNTAESEAFLIQKRVVDGVKDEILKTDLFGSVFDSFERRGVELEIPQPEKDEKYALYTNQGQLGNDAELKD